MESRWSEREASEYVGDLAQGAYLCHLLSREPGLITQVGSSVSVKVSEEDVFGEQETILYVSGSGAGLAAIESDGFVPLFLAHLTRLAGSDELDGSAIAPVIASAARIRGALAVSRNVLLHAVVPAKYAVHVYADAILALANTPDGLDRMTEIYTDLCAVIPYAGSGLGLARHCAEALPVACGDDDGGLALMQQGILAYGETAQRCYERVVQLVSVAERFVSDHEENTPAPQRSGLLEGSCGVELASLRQAVSAAAGHPVVVVADTSRKSLSFARLDDVTSLSGRGPATPDHVRWLKDVPLVGRDVDGFANRYCGGRGDVAGELGSVLTDPAPRIILDSELGMCAVGRTAEDSAVAADLYRHTIDIILAAEALGGYDPLPPHDTLEAARQVWGPDAAGAQGEPAIFAGEVALVTGAASGIGKACVKAFLRRGAAVVGIDINPAVELVHDGPDYLGVCCDLTDEHAVCQALETAARAFGGVDMLVPNAGVFPKGCPIASLTTSEWRRVMAINLDANLVLFREAYPLLKRAPREGRVVVMSSRNVPAPGPGAVAYSASKAALTQMARVAALEWGPEGIRVNLLNPHAVFDTGIWTDEVLKARAAHYGITVEEYKRNNILKVEIESRDVAELVAEMCGPLFSKTTGAQVPIDGGSDRVI